MKDEKHTERAPVLGYAVQRAKSELVWEELPDGIRFSEKPLRRGEVLLIAFALFLAAVTVEFIGVMAVTAFHRAGDRNWIYEGTTPIWVYVVGSVPCVLLLPLLIDRFNRSRLPTTLSVVSGKLIVIRPVFWGLRRHEWAGASVVSIEPTRKLHAGIRPRGYVRLQVVDRRRTALFAHRDHELADIELVVQQIRARLGSGTAKKVIETSST